MRTEFLHDYNKVREIYLSDETFRAKSGIQLAVEDTGKMECLCLLTYSIFLYLDYLYEKVTPEIMSNYIKKMKEYQFHGRTSQLHLVNCTKIKIEDGYSKPLTLALESQIHNEKIMFEVFIPLLNLARFKDLEAKMIDIFYQETR